ncbi:anti-sigma factor [Roseivirga echinicomitans]
MDIKEYIASGILEEYIFDTLSPQERKDVELRLAEYPELREELNAIEESLEGIAMATAIQPPADLKANIMSALGDNVAELKEESTQQKEAPKVIPMPQTNNGMWKYLVAASVSLALVTSYLAYDYHGRWKSTSDAFAQLQAQNTQMAEQYNQVNNRLDGLVADIDIISDSDFKRVNMASVIENEQYTASVYWNAKTDEAYLNIKQLKTLSEEQQYQLWAIVDGVPVDMGVFDFDVEGLLKMKNVQNASMFAVTIEPKGGSVNPTLELMQVAGEV